MFIDGFGSDDDENCDDDDDGDIYIMMKCVSVTKNHHFLSTRAERWWCKASCPLGLAGRRLALAW